MLNPILLVAVGKCLRSDIPFYDSDWRGEAKGGGQTKSTTARINLGTTKKQGSHVSHRKRRPRGMT